MREFLEDAHEHRDDGAGRAQARDKTPLPKRFFEQTGVAPAEGGYSVTLDGRVTRTPGRVPVVVPTTALAQAMAVEWAAQGTHIDAGSMPIVRLVNSALEKGVDSGTEYHDEILKFAASDLLLYRADTPRELVAAQERAWDPLLATLARQFSIKFRPTIGVVHQAQPEQTLKTLAGTLEGGGALELAALVSITGLTGSGLLAIGLWHELFEPGDIWTAAHVDETYSSGIWGADPEAEARLGKRRAEFDAAVAVLKLTDDEES